MKKEEFYNTIKRLEQGPILGRKLYVWCGEKTSLMDNIPEKLVEMIDLQNFNVDINIEDDLAIQKIIKKALKDTLTILHNNLRGQQILLVGNSFLLARYRVPLTPFYDYYLTDSTIAVLILPKPISLKKDLPPYIKFSPTKQLEYFSETMAKENEQNIIIEEATNEYSAA